MLKHVLLASAFVISVPALTQNQPQTATPQPDTNASPAQPQTAPVPAAPTATAPAPQTTPAPTAAVPATPPAPTTAESQPQTAPAPNAQAANPAPTDSATAAATPANPGAQVAEVVNGEFDAQIFESIKCSQHLTSVFNDGAFGDFQNQTRRVEAGLFERFIHQRHHLRHPQLMRRDVNRHRERQIM